MIYVKSKYIVGEVRGGGLGSVLSAVLFNDVVSHDSLRPLFSEIHGAGFFYIEGGKVNVFGESIALKVKSRPEDVIWIERTLRLNLKDI